MRLIKNLNLKKTRNDCQNIKSIFFLLSIISLFYFLSSSFVSDSVFGQTQNQNQNQTQNQTSLTRGPAILAPSLTDPNLKVELVVNNLDFPTSMGFLGNDDILLLEKDTGNVYRIINGNVTGPLVHIDVSSRDERGLLGLAISANEGSNNDNNNDNGNNSDSNGDRTFVFLYYTQCVKEKDQDKRSSNCGNYIYKYRFDETRNILTDPKLILSLPALPGPSHNGGVLKLDRNKDLYVTVGDLQSTAFNQNQTGFDTKAQNIVNGTSPDGRAGILRISQDGKPVGDAILGDTYPLNLYYAYGIKNSFGIGFDPLTGNLWDTENGPQFGDELNLVEPGFNSGWEKAQGIWKLNQTREKDGIFNESRNDVDLVDFNGKGKYSSPEFIWDKPVGLTSVVFFDSTKFGKEYQNDIFVGSVKKGTIFHFDLDKDRKSLSIPDKAYDDDLADLVLDKKDNYSEIKFGINFGIVTDLEVGPDGYLYVVSGDRGTDAGAIYRIIPNSN